MSSGEQLLALRGSKGIKVCNGPPLTGDNKSFSKIENPSCRDMIYTSDGKLMSYCSNQGTYVLENTKYETIFKNEDPRVAHIHFSPLGNYFSTWTPYIAKQNVQESCNLHIWSMASGKCIKSFIQKKQKGWNPQWSNDEILCARNVSNEVHFFEKANFDNIAKKIFMQKVAYFSLAPGNSPYHLACFVPGVKGQPSFVRLFKYPDFEGPNSIIAQKSFFKAERVDFYWNKIGKDVIVLTSVDVDKSGASYYGELNLYYLSVKGETAKLILGKDGPVYSVKWSPTSTEFCVVYGYMPAKATIYNLKCEPVFDFGTGPRNEVAYSPVGDRLSLSGFGNLQGMIEIWDLKVKKLICKFQAQDSTLIEWSYDGEFLLTATTSPRLRIGNGYRIWHYTGSLQEEIFLGMNEELYDIKWIPHPEGTFQEKPSLLTPVPGIQSATPQISKEVYRPPGAHGKQASFKLHDEEEPKTVSKDSSNSISKNKKKRLAKKAKQAENLIEDSEKIESSVKNETFLNELTGDPEKDKKIRSLLTKLEQIEKLKKDQALGKKLEINQLEKIKKADEFAAELAKLKIQ